MANDGAVTAPGALEGLRVLDLAGPMGAYCGKLIADLGADVIRVEPPDGDVSRQLPPFYQGQPGPERSLYYWHFNTNKRGVTLNLESPSGQDLFRQLARTADVVIETFQPGYLSSIGLGYDDLEKINPRLILTSITPFGQTGPFKDYVGEELVGQAAGGLLWMCGWPDRRPVMMGGGPAMHQGSAEGAAGTLIALEWREATGQGQQVDVSIQASLPLTLMTSMPEYHRTGRLRQPRVGNFHGSALNGMFACADGYADFRFRGRPGQWERVVEWLKAEGMQEDLEDEKYRDPVLRREKEIFEHVDDVFQKFIVRYNREDAMDMSQRKGLEVGAVYTAEDILKDPQLQARSFFVQVEHENWGQTFTYPGGPYTLSKTPWRIRRRAPILGEHNTEIYAGELGLSADRIAELKKEGAI
jgi:benzylsuccinate CoA-transferase BbsE subunit